MSRHRESTLDILTKKWSETVENSMRYDCLILSPACQRHEIDAPSRVRLDMRQLYLIEFLVVSDHFFVRISSVGSLWSRWT